MIRTSRPIPLKKIRLVIFHQNKLLIDSEHDLAASVNAMLLKYGRKELPLEVIGTYIGDGAPMLIRRALGDPASREFLQEALNYFLTYYREHKLDSTYTYPESSRHCSGSEGADGTSRRMAVLTNKPVKASRDILAGLGLGSHFFQVYGGNGWGAENRGTRGGINIDAAGDHRVGKVHHIGADVCPGESQHAFEGCGLGFAPVQRLAGRIAKEFADR